MLFSADVYRQSGGVDPRWHLAMDYDLFYRMLSVRDDVAYVPDTLAFFRRHALSKSVGQRQHSAHIVGEFYAVMQARNAFVSSRHERYWQQRVATDIIYRSILALASADWAALRSNMRLARRLRFAPYWRAVVSRLLRAVRLRDIYAEE